MAIFPELGLKICRIAASRRGQTCGKSCSRTNLFLLSSEMFYCVIEDVTLRGHITDQLPLAFQVTWKDNEKGTHMNRPSSPIMSKLSTTRDGLAFEVFCNHHR
jgi:hypothetical protein